MKPFAIADPCNENWDAMRREAGARHCASCSKHVVDLATLTEAQVRSLIMLTGGDLCGRQTIRDGELVLRPTPIAPRGRFPIRLALGGAVIASALAACAPAQASGPEPVRDPIVVAGADPNPTSAPSCPAPAPAPEARPTVKMGKFKRPDPTIDDVQIFFEQGSAKLAKRAPGLLAHAAEALRDASWVRHVRVEGHVADDEGTGKKAAALARARADVVRGELIKRGIAADRLEAVAAAPTTPIASSTHSQNRRVTFVVATD